MALDVTNESVAVVLKHVSQEEDDSTQLPPHVLRIAYSPRNKASFQPKQRNNDNAEPDPPRTRNEVLVNDPVRSTLTKLVQEYRVRGFLVGWPLQPDARPGRECGKVLHLLDSFADSKNPMVHSGRPVALWDTRPWTHNRFDERTMPEDSWRRTLLYTLRNKHSDRETQTCCRPLAQEEYYSSNLQSNYTSSEDCAEKILDQFYHAYFLTPEKRREEKDRRWPLRSNRSSSLEDESSSYSIETYDTGVYSQSLLV